MHPPTINRSTFDRSWCVQRVEVLDGSRKVTRDTSTPLHLCAKSSDNNRCRLCFLQVDGRRQPKKPSFFQNKPPGSSLRERRNCNGRSVSYDVHGNWNDTYGLNGDFNVGIVSLGLKWPACSATNDTTLSRVDRCLLPPSPFEAGPTGVNLYIFLRWSSSFWDSHHTYLQFSCVPNILPNAKKCKPK